ncbi:DUF6157 family protein [Phenylobacterium immobile]|uniref:DUF6157 family protein n=1 Tax=Phenylobacterium immobile TaxID=21 RepID=UPI000B17E007|nr:DUF6157 family protein [Phenylobacterium immobile]
MKPPQRSRTWPRDAQIRFGNCDFKGRPTFLAKSRACLRASPLVNQCGFGLHHAAAGRVALYGRETDAYRNLSRRNDLKVVAGMRSARG